MIPARFSIILFFNKGNTEGTNSLKICPWGFISYLCFNWYGGLWLEKGFTDIIKEEFLNIYVVAHYRVWLSWGDPVQLTGYQNPMTNYLTVTQHFGYSKIIIALSLGVPNTLPVETQHSHNTPFHFLFISDGTLP